MAFKDIHKLKKIAVVEKENISTPYLVIGKDVFTLALYTKLKLAHGPENVRLISEDEVLRSDLFPKGPSFLRGAVNQDVLKGIRPDITVTEIKENALFYKDMTWKSFGGRSKSEALKYDEEFFTGPRLDVDFKQLFSELGSNTDEYLAGINQEAYQVRLKGIKKSETGFSVECINGTEFHSEYLYFGKSPYHYMELYGDKSELSDSFIEFCESTKTSSALFVKFVFESNPLSDMKETLFIPLSYTHEWGHFIGEFRENGGKQEIEFMHFMEDDLMSEEDVSRVIRLLKKSMEKIFDKFLKIKSQEFIILEQELGCLKIDDSLFSKSLSAGKEETKNFFFIGVNAPILDEHCVQSSFEYSREGLSGMTRGLVVQANLLKNLDKVC
jgi:hypothetical protein